MLIMLKISRNWYDLLIDELKKPYFLSLQQKLNEEYNSRTIYPPMDKIFTALNYVKYDDVKVVIVGQDPYHEEGQAMGMSFSVPEGVAIPPSLFNIFKEIKSDLGIECIKNGDLTRWAKQGVLLLNATLTVRKGQAGSHKGIGWEQFTSQIIKLLNEREKPVIFVLWGNNAKAVLPLITNKRHFVLTSAHPSPLSAHNGFFGCKHFSKINNILLSMGQQPIDWH